MKAGLYFAGDRDGVREDVHDDVDHRDQGQRGDGDGRHLLDLCPRP